MPNRIDSKKNLINSHKDRRNTKKIKMGKSKVKKVSDSGKNGRQVKKKYSFGTPEENQTTKQN